MPEQVLMSEIEIISDGGRRRRWTAAEKLRIVEETLDDRASISVAARRKGVEPDLLYRWRRFMLERGSVAVSEDDEVTSNKVVPQREDRRGKHQPGSSRGWIKGQWQVRRYRAWSRG